MPLFNQPLFRRIISAFFILSLLGCSLLSRLSPAEDTSSTNPTRTPLPTYTATAPLSLISIVPTPTEASPPTPVPVPSSPTPLPTEPPQPAEPDQPEPQPTDTPAPPPTEPPPPPPAAPLPTEPPPPPPPPEPAAGPNGVLGKINFRDGKNTYAVGEKVFVAIEATNVGEGLKPFGILGLTPSSGSFQTSWSSGTIAAGETFRHEDGLAFPAPGTHKLWLSICFSTIEVCQGPEGDWERFEPGLDVIIQ